MLYSYCCCFLLQGHSGSWYSTAAGSILLPGSGQCSFIPDRSSHHLQWANLQARSGAQIVVVTVANLGRAALENMPCRSCANWGIGDKNKNNGVLLLIALEERKSRIEVGYGLEGALPDSKTRPHSG